ncbi:sporulation protein [Desulfosporosinus sp. HMP52]|uniref:YtrH family sporulation protein n=1 Tax=Desulfosporosinus sp. HMP52 TaxID=1487923 RepID=UPI00051FD899|nr:YtrH family sporulation protein [Desulfosporosinus sp. HMP52]KGK87789.1 sporulation protein [Desulfosporosinus sp. HMP52]
MVIILASLFSSIVNNFLISFGVVVGASIFGGIGAVITNDPPLKAMLDIASSIKIWAVAVTLGGTFDSFAVIEKGLFEGEFKSIIKQAIYVLTALVGANMGYKIIELIQRCSE